MNPELGRARGPQAHPTRERSPWQGPDTGPARADSEIAAWCLLGPNVKMCYYLSKYSVSISNIYLAVKWSLLEKISGDGSPYTHSSWSTG